VSRKTWKEKRPLSGSLLSKEKRSRGDKMRKLTEEQIESECTFIRNNLEYENMTVSNETMKICKKILEGKLSAEEEIESIRKKYKKVIE
jgi:hypothetical protein